MAKELSYVQPGEKILAQQFNSLVDAIGGPVNPDNSTPFTQTKNGIVFNGGYTTTEPIVDEYNTPLFSTEFSVGSLNSGYYENGVDDWAGVWCFVGDWAECKLFKHEMTFGSFARFTVDFTSQHFRVISLNNLQTRVRLGKIPICNIQSRAQVASFQIMQSAETPILVGQTFSIIGDFRRLPNYPDDPSSTDWMLTEFIEEEDYQDIITAVQNWMSVDEIRLLESRPIYAPFDDIEEQEDIPPVAYNVGQQTIESYPDSDSNSLVPSGVDLAIYYLSSIAFTPAKYFGFQNPDTPTWSYSLYDFNKLDSTADDLSSIQQREDLSSYDVLVKHKAPHPRADEDQLFSDQCSAVLEYMPISSLIGSSNHTGDANLPSHQLSSVYLSSDGQYELFDFHLSGTHYGLTKYDWQYGLSDEVEVVVRDNRTSGQSKVNYIPKSWLSAVGGDTNVIDVRRSVEYVNNPDPYYQLYRFGDDSTIDLDPARHGAFDFVVRYHNAVSQREEVQYGKLDLSSIAPISGDANIIPNAQRSIITVEDLQGNKWQQLYGLGDTGIISAVMGYDGDDHYIMNEGNSWTNPNKQFLYYDYLDKRLKYADICLHMPKVKASDLDDDVIPEISTIIIPEISTIISADLSAQLSALDDRYWIKGEDNDENYGSSIGNSNKTQVIDLDNKSLNCQTSLEHWSTGSLYADYDLKAQTVEATYQFKIGNTTLNESQLQQLLALLNAPQRLQQL